MLLGKPVWAFCFRKGLEDGLGMRLLPCWEHDWCTIDVSSQVVAGNSECVTPPWDTGHAALHPPEPHWRPPHYLAMWLPCLQVQTTITHLHLPTHPQNFYLFKHKSRDILQCTCLERLLPSYQMNLPVGNNSGATLASRVSGFFKYRTHAYSNSPQEEMNA